MGPSAFEGFWLSMPSMISNGFGKSALVGQITDTVPTRAMKGLSLLPNPPIERDGQIFDDDDT
jgi:hypothetical protein